MSERKENSKTEDLSASDLDTAKGQESGLGVSGVVEKAGEVKSKFTSAQAEIENIEKEGRAADGLVKAVCDGGGNLKSVKIDPSLLSSDVAILEELIVNAVAHAKGEVQKEAGQKVQDLLGGLPIPSSITSLIAQYMPRR